MHKRFTNTPRASLIKTLILATTGLAFFSANAQEDVPQNGKTDDPALFTAERVFDLEFAADPQISPDGSTILYARRSMDIIKDRVVGNLWKLDVKSGTHRPVIDGDGLVASPRWSPTSDRIVYLTRENDKPALRVRYMDSGESLSVAQLSHNPSAPVWSPDGKFLAFSMFVPSKAPSFANAPTRPEGAEWAKPVKVIDDLVFRFDGAGYTKEGARHIFVVPAQGGTPRQITDGANDFNAPEWLDNNTILAVANDIKNADLDPIEREIYSVNVRTKARTALTQRDGPDNNPKVSPNQRLIAYQGYDDKVVFSQQTDLYVMNRDGSGVRNLSANYDRSIGSIAWRPDGNAILAQVETDGALSIVSFPVNGGQPSVITNKVGGAAFGRPYMAGSFSVAKRGGSNAGIAFTIAEVNRLSDVGYISGRGKPRTLTNLNEDVFPYLELASLEEIKVKSSHDDREIEAWIALPPGFTADGSYPMILEIHGGPVAMYGPSFSPEIQRYAAQGYVTVYANPRGSSGYGQEFVDLINLAYPGNDHDDLMSVVDAVIAKNYVDKERLFITGGSGGGVLTAWAVGKTDRFAAAATIKPVINWATMALAGDIARFVSRHWLQSQPWENRELYWKLSPISLVGNVTTPTLVMVGEEDWRTPAWEAEQFYTALKVQEIDTALIRIPGASHFIAARPSNLIAKVDNIMGWFEKYDPKKKSDQEE